jgi:hypothetical protein
MIQFRLVRFVSILVIAEISVVPIEIYWTSTTYTSIEKVESMSHLLTAVRVIVQRMKMQVLKILGMDEAQFTI